MADPNASVFNMSDFTVSRRPAKDYEKDVKIPIDNSTPARTENVDKGGGRVLPVTYPAITVKGTDIAGPNFIQGGGIEPGQEQIVIHGQQFLQVDKNQVVRIKQERDSEVTLDERDFKKQKYDLVVENDYYSKFHQKTYQEFVGYTEQIYDNEQKKQINKKETVNRFHNLRTNVRGTEETYHLEGLRFRLHHGPDVTICTRARATVVAMADVKAAPVDVSYSVIKHATFGIDSKFGIFKMENKIVELKAAIAKLDAKGILARVGGACLKGVGAAIGVIRW
ncbi:MAG TPA: hypothetical protein VJ302_24485 [Blastocatellia bacterium]|nr:hypothetical protein [Blastocatellia bacterium]